MRNVFKLRSYDSISKENFNKIQAYCIILQNFNASIHTKSSKYIKKGKNQNTQVNQMQKESNEIASIFTKITEIIGTEHLVIPEKSESSGILDAHALRLKSNVEDSICSPSVCRIVNESRVEESHLGNSQGDDGSPIVHKITEIVRAENATISMEERLEKAGFEFNSEIVEKVLKRCFKVGNLALKFFNWLKHGVGFRHTSDTYNTMIYIAGEAKEFNLMERLIEEMARESCPKDIKTWTILISSYGKVKLIGKALLIFERMRKCGYEPDETVYKVIVSALCNAGKAEIAMEFYKEMVSKNIEVDMNLYKLLLNCLSGSGNISEVRLIGEDMMNVSQIPEQKVYSCILRSFCIARKIREALKLLHELRSKDIMLDPENFEILVKGLCRDGKISDALEIVAIMKQNHVVDAKIHGIVINGYLRRNEVLKALQLFSSMKESGHTPTASTYTELLQQLFRSKEYDRACKLYDEMLGNGIQQDIVALTAVIAGHIQNNCVSQAWKIYEGMKEKKIRLTYKFYSVTVKELCKVLRTDEALKLVDEMRHSKMKVEDNIFQGIISALNKKGEGEKADKVKQMWRTSKLYGQGNDLVSLDTEPQTLCRETEIVIDIYKHKEPDQILCSDHIQQSKVDVQVVSPSGELYEHGLQKICSILSSPLNWSSMQEALEECRIHFTPELVQDVLRRCQLHGHAVLNFFSWVSQHAHYNHTTETYNMAIKISGCAKDFKHMRNLYLEMRRRSCTITSETWTIMIMQYGRAGLTDIALRKFQEMKVDGCKPSKSTFKYLIVLLCGKKGRKVDEAIKTFHQMINARHVPDKELVEIYLQCLCEEGKISDAKWCMESLQKGGFSVPLSYSLVIRSLCRAGRLEEALALEAEVGEEKHTLDQYIYGSLVHGLLRAGRVEEALAKMETMKEGGVGATVHVHTSLIVHFFKEKKIEKALEYFKRIREEGCEPTIVTYSALIRGYMNMGMVIDARNVFRRMKVKGPYPDFKTYSMFITCLCDMGRSEEAMQLINDMLDNGIFPSTVNFRTIFYGLNREGKQDIARTVLQKKWSLVSRRKFNQSNVSIFKSSSHNLTYNS